MTKSRGLEENLISCGYILNFLKDLAQHIILPKANIPYELCINKIGMKVNEMTF